MRRAIAVFSVFSIFVIVLALFRKPKSNDYLTDEEILGI